MGGVLRFPNILPQPGLRLFLFTSSVFCFEASAASDHHVLTFFCTQAALDVEREKMERYLEPRHFVVAWTVAFLESCFGGVKCPVSPGLLVILADSEMN